MKKLILLSIISLIASAQAVAQYVTAGDGTNYTLTMLSGIAESGVTKDGDNYTMSQSVTITEGDSFTLDAGAGTVYMGADVRLRIEGAAYLDAETPVTVTRTSETEEPDGIYLVSDVREETILRNINFEYAGFRAMTTQTVRVHDCSFTFYNNNLSSAGALSMTDSGGLLEVINCSFVENQAPAIGGAANANYGVIIENCYLYDNNTRNSNRPQLNITIGGDRDVIIRNNVITGAQRNKVGAISVANLLGASGTNVAIIEGNEMRYNRYGITTNGAMNVQILNNTIVENKYEDNAMNGGSGISIYDSNYQQTAIISGNHIEDNLWGITVIGGGSVNIGKTSDPTAEDYNRGENIFVNNGNNGVLYDLYNNGTNTIYAQGNQWNVEEQSQEMIETVIYHQYDDATLGEVIFMPPMNPSSVDRIEAAKCFFDNTSMQLVVDEPGAEVAVYAISGVLVSYNKAVGNLVDLSHLPSGVYVAVIKAASTTTVVKCIL